MLRPIPRLAGGAVAAALLLLSLPSPASAAPVPSVTVTDVTVVEGTGGTVAANFTIQATPPPKACCALRVSWATAPGSATAADFTAASGTVSLSKGSPAKVVSVTIAGDTIDEPSETFTVNLSNLVGTPGRLRDDQGIGTITDDDRSPGLTVDDVAIAEGDAGTSNLTFTTSLSAVSALPVTFDWATASGTATAPADFTAAGGSRTIAPGSSSATINVAVEGDTLDEEDETLTVALSNGVNATIDDGSGAGTITDDDPLVVAGIADASIDEGDSGTSVLTFDVTLSAASAKTVTVDWSTQDGLASAPSDYESDAGSLIFLPGDTTETASVTINGDGVAELDEVFHVILSAPSNATLGDADGFGTIVDDELMPVVNIDEPSIAEGRSGTTTLAFAVTLSHPSASPVSVDWTTTPGTAAAGSDYVTANGTVNLAAMDTSETVEVTVVADGTYELDETVLLDLMNGQGAPVGDPQGIGTIENDDAAPVLTVADVTKREGNAGTSTMTFVVTLSGASDVDATVDYATSNGTAAAGSDYTATVGVLTIPAGATTGTVDVPIHGDETWEPAETLSLTLGGPDHASLGDAVALGRIANDDERPTAITLKVIRKPRVVIAEGILEPTKYGHRVTATLFRKQNGRFVRIASKTVAVRYFADRDGDGAKDGTYRARFVRPTRGGTYRAIVRFKGTTTLTPCERVRIFTVRAT